MALIACICRCWPWLLVAVLTACSRTDGPLSYPVELSRDVGKGDIFQGIVWRGAVKLGNRGPGPLPIAGISGLAWDEDEGILYAVSDYGWLYHLMPVLENGYLERVEWLAAYPLRDPYSAPLQGKYRDAEDLAIRNQRNGVTGDTELLVSFEMHPRIEAYDPGGRWRRSVPLPPRFQHHLNFPSPSSGLEAIALHPRQGLLMAPEKGLKGGKDGQSILLSSRSGEWLYPLSSHAGAGLTALEVFDDGSVLSLERAFVMGVVPAVTTLRRFTLPSVPSGSLQVQTVAEFDADEGWIIDNFEGLALHRNGRLFMVSDDNGSSFQSTFLVYIEVPG